MNSDLAAFRAALTGAGNIQAPAPSAAPAPPALAQTFAHLGTLSQSGLQGSAAKLALGAAGGAAGSIADQQKADAKLQLQNEQDNLDALNQQKKDMADPSKYKKEISPDGGYKFFDPTGKEIDVKQFSSATGQHITDVLKKSQNPSDQEFVQNYGNVQKLGQLFSNGDAKGVKKFLAANPDVQKDYDTLKGSLGKSPTFNDIVGAFRSGYPKFFNTNQPTQTSQTTYGNNTLDQFGGGGGVLDKIKKLFGG